MRGLRKPPGMATAELNGVSAALLKMAKDFAVVEHLGSKAFAYQNAARAVYDAAMVYAMARVKLAQAMED